MSYVTLDVTGRWLKPVGALAASADEGIVQDDLDAAEANAMRVTKAKIGWMYNISTWEATTPPLIEYINELLASAEVLEYYLNRDTDITLGAQYEPDRLREEANAFLKGIRSGDMEVTDSSDVLIPRQMISPRQGPRSVSSAARFYPDLESDKSFGLYPRFSAQKTFTDT